MHIQYPWADDRAAIGLGARYAYCVRGCDAVNTSQAGWLTIVMGERCGTKGLLQTHPWPL